MEGCVVRRAPLALGVWHIPDTRSACAELSSSGTRKVPAQMVADGIIESSGDRRWRRYALRGQE